MDGRTQLPVNEFLREKLGVQYVDTITEPGPVRILSEEPQSASAASILNRVDISVHKHGSACVAIVGHWDCTGNPAPEETQRQQLDSAMRLLAARYPDVRILGLWVDSAGSVQEHSSATG
jgi:hypothetical protein